MARMRVFRTVLSVLLAVLMAGPWSTLAAAAAPQGARSGAPQADATPPLSRSDLLTALNLLVYQSVGATGWQIDRLDAALDEAALQSGEGRQAGRGTWTVAVTDDQGQSYTLQGDLDFEVLVTRETGLVTSATTLGGTLRDGGVSLVIAAQQGGERRPQVTTTQLALTVDQTRAGAANRIRVQRTRSIAPVAYGMFRTATQATVERDGQSRLWEETLLLRALGKGQSEAWLTAALRPAEGAAPDAAFDEHFFQSSDGQTAVQFYDRYDVEIAGARYHLQSPSSARLAPDGTVALNLVLVDEQGIPLNPRGGGKSPGVQSPLPGGQARPDLGACTFLTSNEGAFVIGIAASLAFTYLFGAELVLFDLLIGNLATTLIGAWQNAAMANAKTDEQRRAIMTISLLLQLAIGAAGITSPGGLSGFLGNLASFLGGAGVSGICNADPYFLYGDVRPPAPDDAPLRVLAAAGGLISPTQVLANAPANGPPAPPKGDQPLDNPATFVGGSVPEGATAIGTWTWDDTHPFGAAPSHTSGVVDGPHKHYFIHAAQPLALGSDDNIVQYVYLDPDNPPSEIVLQFYTGDGDGERRVYWGTDLLQTGGQAGTQALYPQGALPETGTWVRLRLPAGQIDLSGKQVNGVLFGSYGGRVWWGSTTTSSRLTDTLPDTSAIEAALTLPPTTPGAVFVYRLAAPAQITLEALDADGKVVATLLKDAQRGAGFQGLTWDGRDAQGNALPDVPYRYRFALDGQVAAEGPLSLSPFVANLALPTPFAVMRGNDIPVIGEAYGTAFDKFDVDYGPGLNPGDDQWVDLTTVRAPALLPPGDRTLVRHGAGNLINWNVGLDEYLPWNNPGLNGVYTLRLRVTGTDGRTAEDRVPVVVGRLAATAIGSTIESPDGQARLRVPALASQDSFALLAIVPATDVDPAQTWTLPQNAQPAGTLYEIFPADEQFRDNVTLELPYDHSAPAAELGVLLGDGTPDGWHYLGGTIAGDVLRAPRAGGRFPRNRLRRSRAGSPRAGAVHVQRAGRGAAGGVDRGAGRAVRRLRVGPARLGRARPLRHAARTRAGERRRRTGRERLRAARQPPGGRRAPGERAGQAVRRGAVPGDHVRLSCT
jgi:hypothetical protein